ncbi:MAG: 50S ribosomal protein L11 [Bacteroidota bacterium]
MIKLKIPAGSATMGGTIAPALGQKGVKAKDFCDQFNDATKHLVKGTNVHVIIYVMKDKSFTFRFNTESTTDRIKKMLKIDKGSSTPGRVFASKITKNQLMEIAKEKIGDTSTDNLERMCKIIAGTARSMGVEVENI